jgi:hypothetical protein
MAQRSPTFDSLHSGSPAAPWTRWSSLVRLAVWGGDARCARCGSHEVRRDWSPVPMWCHALGLEPCRCDGCGATFHVPHRAMTADGVLEPDESAPAEPEPELLVPAAPDIDLAALDREVAARLGPRSHK